MKNWSSEKLLRKLGSSVAGEAWSEFLRRFTPVIISVIHQFQHEEQRIHDCYLFVCEKLVDNRFRRLRSWRRQSNYRFSTWLRAIVSNLCIDWHRAEYGRQRPFRTLSDLTELEHRIYRLRFERNRSLRECYEAVLVDYPEMTELELAGIIRQINRTLTPRQHWIISTRQGATISIDDTDGRREASVSNGNGDDPEKSAVREEEQARLEAAMQQLPPDQRLLLRLRYQQGLTLKEVARVAGLADEFKARYQVHLALDQLHQLLKN
jgi:RNA polymerase sigma factor (sigma-70 family)